MGLSILIETPDSTILFDAGPSPSTLESNAVALGKNLSLVDFVVISHSHYDHVDGLPYVARVNPNITVYIPGHMAAPIKDQIRNLGFNVVDVTSTTVVAPGISIIGELEGILFSKAYEQGLAINVAGVGLGVIVGCSHPRVENIVAKGVNDLQINAFMVIGGFHLWGISEQELNNTVISLLESGIKKIYPIHCSGVPVREFIQQNYPEYYGGGCVGCQLLLNTNFLPPTTSNQETVSTTGFSCYSIATMAVLAVSVSIFHIKKRR
ncbi:MAG: MBL fold metallo-hydrolase [Candidatus Hodarchaeota archaeon]